MLNVRLAGDHLYGKLLFTRLSLVMSMMMFFRAVLFPTRCLGWDLGLNWVSFWGFSYLLFVMMPWNKFCFIFMNLRFTNAYLPPGGGILYDILYFSKRGNSWWPSLEAKRFQSLLFFVSLSSLSWMFSHEDLCQALSATARSLGNSAVCICSSVRMSLENMVPCIPVTLNAKEF